MLPIRNSDLNKFRMKYLGKEFNIEFLKKYLHFGSLVDALITEPEQVDFKNNSLMLDTRYDCMRYYFKEDDLELANLMRESFFEHPFCAAIARHGEKYIFTRKDFEFDGELIWTEGETDMLFTDGDINLDVKMTAAQTEKEFFKAVKEYYYDQQGSWYIDNVEVSRHVVAGISRKAVDDKGLPVIFLYPIVKGHRSYEDGYDRYSYWLRLLLQERKKVKVAV